MNKLIVQEVTTKFNFNFLHFRKTVYISVKNLYLLMFFSQKFVNVINVSIIKIANTNVNYRIQMYYVSAD